MGLVVLEPKDALIHIEIQKVYYKKDMDSMQLYVYRL